MPEVVEAHLWQPRLLEQRLEGPLHKVLRLNRRPGGGGEDKALIFVEPGESHSVLELALAVSLESVHRPGREVHPPPAAFSLRLSKSVEASLSHQGAAHPERALLQDCVILTKAQDLPAPQPSGDRQHVEGLEGKAVIIRTDPTATRRVRSACGLSPSERSRTPGLRVRPLRRVSGPRREPPGADVRQPGGDGSLPAYG